MFCMYSFILSKFWGGPCVSGMVSAAGGGVVEVVAGGFVGGCSECGDFRTRVNANGKRKTYQGLVLLE